MHLPRAAAVAVAASLAFAAPAAAQSTDPFPITDSVEGATAADEAFPSGRGTLAEFNSTGQLSGNATREFTLVAE